MINPIVAGEYIIGYYVGIGYGVSSLKVQSFEMGFSVKRSNERNNPDYIIETILLCLSTKREIISI